MALEAVGGNLFLVEDDAPPLPAPLEHVLDAVELPHGRARSALLGAVGGVVVAGGHVDEDGSRHVLVALVLADVDGAVGVVVAGGADGVDSLDS